MSESIKTVNAAELRSFGIYPECPMCSPRKPNEPIDVRYGNDRITRSASGAISHHFLYYGEYQIAARKKAAEQIAKAIKGNLRILNR